MKEIKKIIDSKISAAKENLLYQLLGQFGDRLPSDVQVEIRKMATSERTHQEKLTK